MSLFIDAIAPEARARYVELGRQFGCADTLAQAELTLKSLSKFGKMIANYGFIKDDTERLRAATSLLSKESEANVRGVAQRKRTSRGYIDAVRNGKSARQRARSILYIIAQRLAYSGDIIESEAARAVAATIQHTESSRGDPIRLASQLDQLRAALSIPRVNMEAERRGGLDAVKVLEDAAEHLRSVTVDPEAAPQSTSETAHADL
ncbi:MAG: hypothetical protein CSA75_04230, partial [Sorangium cellulosum]